MRPGKKQSRRLTTMSGPIEFERPVFHCPACRATYAPLDEELGAGKGDQYTRRVRRAMAYAGAGGSFGEASKAMKENFGLEIAPSQIAVVVEAEGERIAAAIEKREEQWREGQLPPEAAPDTIVLMADATSVLTRKGEEHKMVNVARGFDLDARTAGVKTGNKAEQTDRPAIVQSRYAATAREESAAGGADSDLALRIFALACRLGVLKARRLLFIADGSAVLWRICDELFPDAICIQDLWHVLEYLAQAAAMIAKTPGEIEAVRRHWAEELKKSHLDAVIEELAEARKRLRSPEKREVLRKAIDYIDTGRERMDYARYIAEGLPIGSGPIEAACKHLVKERYDISGARWSRAKVGNVLALRVAIANEEWELHWRQKPSEQLLAA